MPVTWFREKIVEPLHDRYKRPYYHRKLNRVPEVDQCGVNDAACIYEAAEQFRLDKLVDRYILHILQNRAYDCLIQHKPYREPCIKLIDDWQESELNWFIKYGELGASADVMDCYMKQKHRMVWERRHPEIMEERQKRYEEHKRRVENGDLDYHFYKKGLYWQDKKNYLAPYEPFTQRPGIEGDQPLSKDWQYYKKLAEDPEFDKKQGKTADYSNNPFRGRW
uniref:NADH dehydrogenase [ubiquinone] 1 beta subcomplex subunit 10 n=2 Tax=Acrobeloides nanus TaxID=290746 RepID=A0A914DN23_9BILA